MSSLSSLTGAPDPRLLLPELATQQAAAYAQQAALQAAAPPPVTAGEQPRGRGLGKEDRSATGQGRDQSSGTPLSRRKSDSSEAAADGRRDGQTVLAALGGRISGFFAQLLGQQGGDGQADTGSGTFSALTQSAKQDSAATADSPDTGGAFAAFLSPPQMGRAPASAGGSAESAPAGLSLARGPVLALYQRIGALLTAADIPEPALAAEVHLPGLPFVAGSGRRVDFSL